MCVRSYCQEAVPPFRSSMAVQAGGVSIQQKVSRLLSRQNGKPVLKPNRPLVLQDTVANRKPKKAAATCLTEMTILMACWKKNNFEDSLCSTETNNFYNCVKKAKVMKNKFEQTGGGRLPPKEATTLLKRFPNNTTEI